MTRGQSRGKGGKARAEQGISVAQPATSACRLTGLLSTRSSLRQGASAWTGLATVLRLNRLCLLPLQPGQPLQAAAVMRLDLPDAAGAAQQTAGVLASQAGGALGLEARDELRIGIGQLVPQQVAAVDQGL